MSMVLEYPAKMILYIVVITVLIGIMLTFRGTITNFCLVPPCNEQTCNTKTYVENENALTRDVAEKYCNLCWSKSQGGVCSERWVCYGVNLDLEVRPSFIELSNDVKEFCNIECDEKTKTVFFEYDHISGKVRITC